MHAHFACRRESGGLMTKTISYGRRTSWFAARVILLSANLPAPLYSYVLKKKKKYLRGERSGDVADQALGPIRMRSTKEYGIIFRRWEQGRRLFARTAKHNILKTKRSRYRPDVAQRVGRGIALLFHDRDTRRGWVVSSTPRPHFTPAKDPVPIVREAGWAPGPVWTSGKSRPHRDSVPDRSPRSAVVIATELPGPNENVPTPYKTNKYSYFHFPE